MAAMDPEPVLQEIAEVFLRFVSENPDMALILHVRVGPAAIDLAYRGRELADQSAVAFGIRAAAPRRPVASRAALAAERR
jgi:hypothetical protein